MHERNNLDNQEVMELDELEPLVLAKVTQVTGTAPGGSNDVENVVWGTLG